MKILVVDIETQPALAEIWGMWNENIPLARLRRPTSMLCFAAKWHDADESMFFSDWQHGHRRMVKNIHRLLDEADVVVHYNGQRFDVPHINREIAKHGLRPPSPFKQIDLYRVVKSTFKLDSNKLDHAASYFGLGNKVDTGGYDLWRGVMDKDPVARSQMEVYNRADVLLTERLYLFLRPWIYSHPSAALLRDSTVTHCNKCDSTRLHRRGTSASRSRLYQRYQCQDCGGWMKGTRAIGSVGAVGVG